MGSVSKNELKVVIGENLRIYRKRDGLTQAELAEKAHISLPYYSALENGKKLMSPVVLLQLAEALDVSADSILRKPGAEHDIENIKIMLKDMPHETASALSDMIRVFVKREGGNADH